MTTTKITAPVKGFTGSTAIGPAVLDFTDGVAVTDVELQPGTVAYLEANGYKVEGEESGEFDPSAHSAEDVVAYLQTADADEVARVKAAEADGKGRKTIADYEPKSDDDEGDEKQDGGEGK